MSPPTFPPVEASVFAASRQLSDAPYGQGRRIAERYEFGRASGVCTPADGPPARGISDARPVFRPASSRWMDFSRQRHQRRHPSTITAPTPFGRCRTQRSLNQQSISTCTGCSPKQPNPERGACNNSIAATNSRLRRTSARRSSTGTTAPTIPHRAGLWGGRLRTRGGYGQVALPPEGKRGQGSNLPGTGPGGCFPQIWTCSLFPSSLRQDSRPESIYFRST